MKLFWSRYRAIVLLVLSGALSALPVVLPKLGFLQWVAMIPAILVLLNSAKDKSMRLKAIYGRGLMFFWAYYAVGFHWFFYMYPLDFAGLSNAASLVVVLFACFGLSFLQALFSAFVFVIVSAVCRFDPIVQRPYIVPFVSAATFVIAEWFQTIGWWGVPWSRLPLGQVEVPLLIRSASLFGSYFITFVIVGVNFCIACAILNKKFSKILLSVAVSLFCLNLALGTLVTLTYKEEGESITVAAAQGNIPPDEKWDEDSLYNIINIYESLTVAASYNGATVVVWPETAIPYDLFTRPDIEWFVCDLAGENSVTILLPVFTGDEESDLFYNSIVEVRPDGKIGKNIYSKQRLVPFGEFVPMRELITILVPPLAEVRMLEDDLLPGSESVVLETVNGNIGCGICFDSIYEELIRESVLNGAEVIAISTNDSWFSDSAALSMHNSQSVLRAVENGRYVVRSANTGISSVIDPMGRVVDSLGANREGYVLSEVYLRDDLTLYTHIGNLIVWLCIAFDSALLLILLYDKKKNQVNINSVT